MADKTKIEWANATWNPVTGCSPVSLRDYRSPLESIHRVIHGESGIECAGFGETCLFTETTQF